LKGILAKHLPDEKIRKIIAIDSNEQFCEKVATSSVYTANKSS